MPGEVDGMLKGGWTWEVQEAAAAPEKAPDPAPEKIDRRRREHRNANR